MNERRRHRRFQQWNKAIVQSASGVAGPVPRCPVDACAWDLSLGGARIQSDEMFPVGAVLRLHLELVRSREYVGIDGDVRWSRWNEEMKVYECGVEFRECVEATLQAIMRNLYHETDAKDAEKPAPAPAEPAAQGDFLAERVRRENMGGDMTPRKDRRFKQWNKTKILRLVDARTTNGHPPVDAFTYDLSIGGARLHTAQTFDVGSLIRLEIELVRTEEVLRVEAVVKWQRWDEMANVYEMGVEFQHTSMVTVLSLMKNLHDGRRSAPSPKAAEPHASVSRS